MIRRILLIAAVTAAALPAADCDRACLHGFVDSYLDAMAKHDPSKLPVSETVKFTEAETLVCRKGEAGFFAPKKLTTAPAIFGAPLKESEKSTRSQLIDDASAYFTAVQSEGTKHYKSAPLGPEMNRFENGVETTNVPVLGSPAMSGAEQLDKGIFKGLVVDTGWK
jgi:hypothetical protein